MNKSIYAMNHSKRYQDELVSSAIEKKACGLGRRAAALVSEGWKAPNFQGMSLDDIEGFVIAEELTQASELGIDALNYSAIASSDQDEADRQDEIGFARYGF